MTGVTQITGKINEQNAEELETEYFEVSWHADARPTHQEWQGRVYSKKDLEEVCGLGTGDGLAGWNCRHTYYLFIPGVSERLYTDEQLDAMNEKENTPKEWDGKMYTSYEASQRQRRMETSIRAWKRKIKLLQDGGASDDVITAAKCRYRTLMDEYVRFSEAMKMPQQKERFYIGKQAKKKDGLAAGKSSVGGIPKHDPPKLLKKIKFSDRRMVMKEIAEFEVGAVKKNIETACVITKNGEVYQCFGIKDRVFVDSDLKEKLHGAIISHNHPISETTFTFSNDDLSLFLEYNLETLRGCDEKYTYELTRDKSQIDEMLTDWTTEENYWHCVMIKNALQYGFGYRRWKNE